MCTAILAQLISRIGYSGIVEVDGVRCKANLRLLPQVEVGEYVLVHAGFAIQKVDPQATRETLELIRKVIREFEEEGDKLSVCKARA